MSKEHRMAARSSRTLGRNLSSARSGVVARTSGQRPPKSGDSQSPEIALRVAQVEATAQAAYTLAEEALKIILHMAGATARHMRYQGRDAVAEACIEDHMKSATYALAKWRERLDAEIASLVEQDRTNRGGW